MKKKVILAFLPFFMITVCMANEASISGKALYFERMALPSNAVFEATLEDISLMDEPSIIVGEMMISPAGQIPIAFEIKFNKDDIKKTNNYSVRARITVDGKIRFMTDTANFVFKGKDDSKVKLIMKKIKHSLEPTVMMQGMYQYMADAALFKECITGRKLPVLFEKDNLALEKAYNQDKKEIGALLKVQLEGKIVQRPKMEGEGMRSQLLVEHFIKTMPNESCANQHVDTSFSNMYWKLTALHGERITTKANTREAHIIFRSLDDGEGKFKGTTGCNTMSGSYEMQGEDLSINHKQVALTKMTCPDSKIEKSFLLALKETVNWQIKGDHLELRDESSKVLAHFEAVYF